MISKSIISPRQPILLLLVCSIVFGLYSLSNYLWHVHLTHALRLIPSIQYSKSSIEGGGATTGFFFEGNILRPMPDTFDFQINLNYNKRGNTQTNDSHNERKCSGPNVVGVTTVLYNSNHQISQCVLATLQLMPVVLILDLNNHNESVLENDQSYPNYVDDKLPNQHRLYVLSLKQQDEMFSKLSKLIPRNNYGRKNLGYLFAELELNACSVWDFDDDNYPPSPSFFENIHKKASLSIFSSKYSVVNPYLLYGSPEFIWPRGYPIEYLSDREFPRLIPKKNPLDNLLIVQVLQEVDPDVDAIWRLQYGAKWLPMQWDTPDVLQVETMSLATHTWAPFNAQSTLILAEALPFAYLPCSVHGRVSDIWRSYIMQFFLGTDKIGFSGAFVKHYRNKHNYMADFNGENQLYEQTRGLIQFLEEKSNKIVSRSDLALTELISELYMRGFINKEDLYAYDEWSKIWSDYYSIEDRKSIPSFFNQSGHYFRNIGSESKIKPLPIVAILHLNFQLRRQVVLWMALHGHKFDRVEIYVPGLPQCLPISGLHLNCISGDFRGYIAYESMVHAIENKLIADNSFQTRGIKGFLFIHDDIVWSNGLLEELAEKEESAVEEKNILDLNGNWFWLDSEYGKRAMNIYKEHYDIHIQSFNYGQSDFFYVTVNQATIFAEKGRQMMQSGIFLEIAVPTLLHNARVLSYITSWDYSNLRIDVEYMASLTQQLLCKQGDLGKYYMAHPIKLSKLPGLLAHFSCEQDSH